ncbi:hypothetical protein DMUE_5489, partial [Dictyocoela muelleri]
RSSDLEYKNINLKIRKGLTKNRIAIHYLLERLYLKRNDFLKWLTNVTHLSDRIFFNIKRYVSNNSTERQKIIIKYFSYNTNSVFKLNELLQIKYRQNINNIKYLYNLQKQNLHESLTEKSLQCHMHRSIDYEKFYMTYFTLWLTKYHTMHDKNPFTMYYKIVMFITWDL